MRTQSVTKDIEKGPLLSLLPPPPDARMRTMLVERLGGHTTSEQWLPAGLWDELDQVRDRHLKVRSRVLAELRTLRGLESKFAKEDRDYDARLRDAHRTGDPGKVKDRRTAVEKRTAQRDAVERRLWAGVTVLAEVADEAIAVIRERENEWLGDLRVRLAEAEDKRGEAERLVAAARREEWRIQRLGQWVMAAADDGPFGRQPTPPADADPPANLSPDSVRRALERPWYKPRVAA
jgi:hypothetical protein